MSRSEKNDLPADYYNCRLGAANVVACLINVLMPVLELVLHNHKDNLWSAYVIFRQKENLCLAASCFMLVWGFQRLIKIVRSSKDNFVKKAMIGWHIAAYFFIFTAKIVQNFTLHNVI